MGEAHDEHELLQFLTPGFLHGLSNALFAIQSRVRFMDQQAGTDDAKADLTAILAACERTRSALTVYRALGEPGGSDRPSAAGPLLRALLTQARIALRDHGVGIRVDESAYELATPVAVDELVTRTTAAIAEMSELHCRTLEFEWDDARPDDEVGLRIRALDGESTGPETLLTFRRSSLR